MEASIHRFARLLRTAGMRVSVSEVLDALGCAAVPGVLAERETFRQALRTALVKDHRDSDRFDELFDAFFALIRFGSGARPGGAIGAGSGSGGELDDFTIADELGQRPPKADMESPDADLRDIFDNERMAERYSPHPELNPIILDNQTQDEIVFSQQDVASMDNSNQVQLEMDRMHGAAPGQLSTSRGTPMDADLSLAEQDALLGWLDSAEDSIEQAGDEQDAAELRDRMSGVLAALPEALKRHIEALMALERATADGEQRAAMVDVVSQEEQDQLEESLRRLAFSLRGAPTHRKREAARGRIDSARTMRRNMRYDGVPFRPITVAKAEDKPRLVVLADVSLSVRATARFTLHLVHGLQDRFRQVRAFAFVAGVAEVTELFAQHHVEYALGLVFGGDVLDVDANSDYGSVFGDFLEEYGSAVTRRTTVLVLGDGRGNGNDPNLAAFEEISRRAKETIWLTPEPRYSWGLGPCDLPSYAEHCDRVRVVRDLSGLDSAAHELAAETTGR
ncbi:VWA domain-containing protein [Amycolatopsis antarctica]|uniref:VWA domain-containing protein n=1 Tax=Amycolatopsis antarctica TaxID=1854586 RepID=A0A263D0C3_9PSEU|nr:VWA domain-containing protein [Amycolatopsis antarctica]OZM71669.1 VWA domain-containing protein [Amycolatopsis antarctica]